MAKISREIKIGIYFIITIVALYWGINFLQGKDIFGKLNTFYTTYNNVEGLQATSNVYIKGLKVGTVESIKFKDEDTVFIVTMNIQSKYNIPINSVAHLYSADIMGNKAIKIEVSSDTIYLASKSKLASAIDPDLISAIEPLKIKAEKLMEQMNQTFNSVNRVLDSTTVTNLNNSVASLSSTLANFERLSSSLVNDKSKISSTLTNFESISSNLKNNNDKINNIVHNFSTLSDSLANIKINDTFNDLQAVVNHIKEGEGTLGKIIQNDSLYNNLTNSLKNMDLLLKDLRDNPKRYINLSIFGN